jgi:hypothetical protein
MNYTIEQSRELIENKIANKGYSITYTHSLCGRVYWKTKEVFIPQIKTRASLYIACHELFHVLRERKENVYINEFKAEKFAHRYLRYLGFSVPRKQTKRAKRYVAYKLQKAFNRGHKQIDVNKDVKKFLN